MKFFKNHKLKGAISIFLVIITIPTMLLSAVLIDGSRMASAKAITQEAADLAAASALAVYNQPLKDQYGLFAMEDSANLEALYKESLEATLLAYGMSGDAEYSERLWDIMKTTLTGQKSYMEEPFLNLYDFSVDRCDVEPLYSLAEQDVLENQMVEYAKFRGLYVMADRLDIIKQLEENKKEAEENRIASQIMEDLMGTNEENIAADKAMEKLRQAIEDLNKAVNLVKPARDSYLESLRAEMEQIRIENTDVDDELSSADKKKAKAYEANREMLKKAAEDACKAAQNVIDEANNTQVEVEKAKKRLGQFQDRNRVKASGNQTAQELFQDAQGNIKIYDEDYLKEIQVLLDDPILKRMSEDTDIKSKLDRVMKGIHKAITDYIDVIDELREEMEEREDGEEEEITDYYYYYLNSSESTKNAGTAYDGGKASRCYRPAIDQLLSYFTAAQWDPQKLNPARKYEGTSVGQINSDFAKNQSEADKNKETSLEGEAAKGEVQDAVYKARPSKTFQPTGNNNDKSSFYNEKGDLTASKNILAQGEKSMILDIGEVVRDDVLGLTYMFGTFKTRLTGVKKFSSEGMSEADKKSFYMPKWRYAHPEGELDMRFTPKKERETVLRSEIEYLIYGNRKDGENETAVYATIFAERLANNLIAMYMDKGTINPACHAAAGLASAATIGTVPEPVFFWIFLTACATAETALDMDYLISGGYKIPLLKKKDNLLLSKMISRGKAAEISDYGQRGLFVSYEDYLMILLLIKEKEKRIMRTADLIEMNMKKNGNEAFTMAGAYTYLYADTKLSIRYLFGSVGPFQEDYAEKGYTGRMRFSNTIYLGY